ncbi:Tn3 family transposase [Alteromonas oceanisediminis]|uniref:Tn3 family transposase n=3 Tax=Alteromonas TaxID=226 RepID=UPI001BDAA8E1|nr:Tn3 family transposase [Alteromonas oceanisediminis]MBT0588117.1 Tn3 family transposase [Alteromonas oceanisediminis]
MAIKNEISILTSAEQLDLYSPPIFSVEEQRLYFTLNDAELAVCRSIRLRAHQCYFVAILGYFKSKPVILDVAYSQVTDDLTFISKALSGGKGLRPFTPSQKQKDRLYAKVLDLSGYGKWEESQHFKSLFDHLVQIGNAWLEPRHLFDAAIEYLATHHIAIPKYTVLQRLISRIRQQVRKDLKIQLNQLTSNELNIFLDSITANGDGLSLSHLRGGAKNLTVPELKKELAIYHRLAPWHTQINDVVDRLNLSLKNRQHFSELINYYGSKVRRFKRSQQHLWLLCHLTERIQLALERLTDGFVYQIRKQQEAANAFAQQAVFLSWQSAADNVTKAAELLHLFVDENIDDNQPFSEVRKQALKVMDDRDIQTLCLYLKKQKRTVEEYQWQYYDEQHNLLEQLLRPVFLCLECEAGNGSEDVVAQLQKMQTEIASGEPLTTMDTSLIPKKHLPWLVKQDNVNPQRYEWLLYRQLTSRLNGRIYLSNVTKYRALEDDLIPQTSQDTLLESSTLDRLKQPVDALLQEKQHQLESSLNEVARHIDEGDNRNVIMKNRSGTRWRLPTKGATSLVNNPFFKRMQPVGIADVLRYVERETGFMRCLTHVLPIQKQGLTHLDDLLAILIANATHRGVYGMAQISDRSYEHLSTIQANYIRPETLNDASDIINNAVAALPIFRHYHIQEDQLHASADGQKFETHLETFKTRYSSKYFGTNKGITAMTLVANHSALNARIIGSNEHESHYIYDLLQSNSSDVKPDVLSTDTHGVNHVNFALLDLCGYSFAPRYAQFNSVINDLFEVTENEQGSTILTLKKPIRNNVIATGWQDVRRIVLSLQTKRTTQSMLVRKLSGYPSGHPILQALTEYNRLIKAQYLLDYIDNASLRQYVQRALNRGEAWHFLRRAIASVNGDQFRGKNESEIAIWNECARLIANAIIYFNSAILSHLLGHFEATGDEEKAAITRAVSPVAWQNINLSGTYNFTNTGKLPDMSEITRPIVDN